MNFLKKATVAALVLSLLVAFAVSFGSLKDEEQPQSKVPDATGAEEASEQVQETVQEQAQETVQVTVQEQVQAQQQTETEPDGTAEESTVNEVHEVSLVTEDLISSGYVNGSILSKAGEQATEADDASGAADTDETADYEANPGRGDEGDFSDFSELEDGDTDEEMSASYDETRIDGFEYFTRVYRTDEGRVFKVPLSFELQEYTYDMCMKYNVPYRIIMGLFGNETSWRADIGVINGYVGLGMLNVEYNASYFAKRGIDIYTAKGNIEAVCYTMAEKLQTFGGNISYALMAYNLGTAGAKNTIANGTLSTSYSRRIISLAENLLTDEQYYEMKNK